MANGSVCAAKGVETLAAWREAGEFNRTSCVEWAGKALAPNGSVADTGIREGLLRRASCRACGGNASRGVLNGDMVGAGGGGGGKAESVLSHGFTTVVDAGGANGSDDDDDDDVDDDDCCGKNGSNCGWGLIWFIGLAKGFTAGLLMSTVSNGDGCCCGGKVRGPRCGTFSVAKGSAPVLARGVAVGCICDGWGWRWRSEAFGSIGPRVNVLKSMEITVGFVSVTRDGSHVSHSGTPGPRCNHTHTHT
jgi:hypothetical protein